MLLLFLEKKSFKKNIKFYVDLKKKALSLIPFF